LFGQILKRLAGQGNLLIVSHHDLRMVPALFDEVIFLNGELVAYGPTDQLFNEETIARTFGTHTFSGAHT
jgi:ABC-type Mn2+/Zn2+ transport system ATPase subunit